MEQLAQLRVVSFGREPGEDIMKIVFFSLFARPILLVACVRGAATGNALQTSGGAAILAIVPTVIKGLQFRTIAS